MYSSLPFVLLAASNCAFVLAQTITSSTSSRILDKGPVVTGPLFPSMTPGQPQLYVPAPAQYNNGQPLAGTMYLYTNAGCVGSSTSQSIALTTTTAVTVGNALATAAAPSYLVDPVPCAGESPVPNNSFGSVFLPTSGPQQVKCFFSWHPGTPGTLGSLPLVPDSNGCFNSVPSAHLPLNSSTAIECYFEGYFKAVNGLIHLPIPAVTFAGHTIVLSNKNKSA